MWQLYTQRFWLFLYLTGVHFRGKLQHGGDVSQQKIKCRPSRTQEIGGVSLSDVLYVNALSNEAYAGVCNVLTEYKLMVIEPTHVGGD